MDSRMEKSIESVLGNFYANNNIHPENYTDSMEDAYLNNKKYDIKISLPVLKSNVEKWVQEFELQDKEYFLKLLEQFTYLTQDALAYRMSKLCDCLFSKLMTLGIEKSKVLFVVIESKSGIKSGADEMASNLWNVNRINDLKKSQIITAFSKVKKEKIKNAGVIIFLDDILATGFTMREQIDMFLERFGDVCDQTKLCYFTGVLATKSAINYVKKKMRTKAIKVEPFIQEEQLIKSAFKGDYIFGNDIVKGVEHIIRKYEDMISSYNNEEDGIDFSMGFRQCKLLLAFHYETPNNTLCSFWKATDKNHPIFERSEYSRPSIDTLKKRKSHMANNAYLHKSINRGKDS